MNLADGKVEMVIWDDPWLPSGWGGSEFFIKKWSWVIYGVSRAYTVEQRLEGMEVSTGLVYIITS